MAVFPVGLYIKDQEMLVKQELAIEVYKQHHKLTPS
jgi:hypothetical protein